MRGGELQAQHQPATTTADVMLLAASVVDAKYPIHSGTTAGNYHSTDAGTATATTANLPLGSWGTAAGYNNKNNNNTNNNGNGNETADDMYGKRQRVD